MGKVFRYHKGVDTIEDWQLSNAYGKNAIKAIEDPAGATSRKEITSIPSPFARMDLVKTAFEHIVDEQKIEGNTIFHKMVSDALDIGEILFNMDRFQGKIRLIVWDKRQDLQTLLHSSNRKHRLLGETIRLYLQQDARSNNFDELQRIYLLNYIGGLDPINIIGGTSPVSLFFTSANKLSEYVDIRFGNHQIFGDEYQPLYKRDFEYQKYIYGLQKFLPGFNRYFKAVDDYLGLNFRQLTDEQRDSIRGIKQADFHGAYDQLSVGNDGNRVEILGYTLRKRVERPTNIEEQSGFVIDSNKYVSGVKPLVLPIDTYTERVRYTSADWDGKNKAAPYDARPYRDRTLPYDGSKYPYLTASDFLEPYIIRTIYPINKGKFFDGNFSQRDGEVLKGYLLPVKKVYFDFFDTGDLQGVTADGKKRIEIRQGIAGGIHVTLRIPIRDGKYIAYERTYYPPANDHEIAQPDEPNNKGAIIENQFTLILYPFIKLQDDKSNNYRIALVDRDILPQTIGNKYRLQFYKNYQNEQVTEKAVRTRSEKATDRISSDYYVVENSGFDYIQIKHNWGSGMLVPVFSPSYQGTSQFTFAIDFGTTNTHIEYRKDGGEPRPFEINESDIQIATLHIHDPRNPETVRALNAARANSLVDIVNQEFVPELINKLHEFHFPFRTAISSKKSVELNRSVFALADFNIPFVYEKYQIVNSAVRTNLKWSEYSATSNDMKVVASYFESLLLLIRNKILLNDGDLSKTKLIWLYPSSMTEYRINLLESTWNELFKRYITDAQVPFKISESIAPFYYFNRHLGVAARANSVVSIDIGGGTSDVVIFTDDKPQLLTSFRYAANAVFGDAFGRSWKINGFIQHYLGKIKGLLQENKQQELLNVLEDIQNTGKSEDIIAFFFAIEKNKKLMEQNVAISFHKKLSLNSDFKIVFLLFYSALVYHIAKLMKATGLGVPRHVTFSGTGSKIINIIDGSHKLNELSELTKLIFQRVAGSEGIPQISLMQEQHPKEISCKGALMIDESKDIALHDIKKVLVGTEDDVIIPNLAKTYNEVDEDMEHSVVAEYSRFLDLFFGLDKTLNFKNKFGVSPSDFELYKAYLSENALDDLKASIALKKNELKAGANINFEETLFFYPLIGGLNHLAFKIQENNTANT